MAVELDV